MARRIKYYGGKKQTLPIKDKKLLKRVFDYLLYEYDHANTPKKKYQAYRNYILILTGCNTAFRAEDLLQLRVKDVIKGYMSIKENKTGKMQHFPLNDLLYKELLKYVKTYELKDNDYLFMGQKKIDTFNGIKKKVIYPITRQACEDPKYGVITKIIKNCGIDFPFALHSLRKTFGYQYYLNGGDLITLMRMYQHDEPSTTLLYVMWNQDDVEKARKSIFIGQRT